MHPPLVAVVRTTPPTVAANYARLFSLAPFRNSSDGLTIVVPELSWHHFLPSVNTPPWQLEAVLREITGGNDGAGRPVLRPAAAHGVRLRFAVILNRHQPVLDRFGLEYEQPVDVPLETIPAGGALGRIFPEGVRVPADRGARLVLLPTLKTHAVCGLSGSLAVLFRYIVRDHRLVPVRMLPEVLPEVLALAHARYEGIFSVMDGTWVGNGPGPRRVTPREGNVLAASADPVALDALGARLLGINPFDLPYLARAHDMGLGVAEFGGMELAGDDPDELVGPFRWQPSGLDAAAAAVERTLPPSIGRRAALFYDDFSWYRRRGEKIWLAFEKTEWGKVFEGYRR